MKNAKYFNDSRVKITVEDVRKRYPEFGVGSLLGDENGEAVAYEVMNYGEITSFARRDREGLVEIVLPGTLAPSLNGRALWPLDCNAHKGNHPYGKEFTERIAAGVFHRGYEKHRFGLVPGRFRFNNGGIIFQVEPNPLSDSVDAILFYADGNMKSYGGVNKLACFNIGNTGLYGMVIPLNHLVEPYQAFTGHSIVWLRNMMADGLSSYLAQIA